MSANGLPSRLARLTTMALALGLAGTALGLPTAAAASPPPDPRPCRSPDLTVTLHTNGGGAAGSLYARLLLHNNSPVTCRTGGFAGVSYLGTPQHTQIGVPAVWIDLNHAHALLLPPGGNAVATLREADAGNFPTGRCRPHPTDGLRVYPPNQTTAIILAQHTLGCRNPAVQLLTITPFRQR